MAFCTKTIRYLGWRQFTSQWVELWAAQSTEEPAKKRLHVGDRVAITFENRKLKMLFMMAGVMRRLLTVEQAHDVARLGKNTAEGQHFLSCLFSCTGVSAGRYAPTPWTAGELNRFFPPQEPETAAARVQLVGSESLAASVVEAVFHTLRRQTRYHIAHAMNLCKMVACRCSHVLSCEELMALSPENIVLAVEEEINTRWPPRPFPSTLEIDAYAWRHLRPIFDDLVQNF